MPMATFRSDPDRIDYTPGGAVAAGDVVILNEIIGISTQDIPANTQGSLAIKGIFDITKKTLANTYSVGEFVFFEAGAGATKVDTDKLAGVCVLASSATNPVVRVSINVGTFVDS